LVTPDKNRNPTAALQRLAEESPPVSRLNRLTSLSNPVAQREKFIGVKSKHHLHIEINQDHYKFGNHTGGRIELGSNGSYVLDQLISARNFLIRKNYTSDGGQDCIDWLETECKAHGDWDEDVGYVPSWEREVPEDNPHVDGILEKGEQTGYDRAGFENSLVKARLETLEEAKIKLDAGHHYGPNEDGVEASQEAFDNRLKEIKLRDLLASWSGFSQDAFSPDAMDEEFTRAAKERLHEDLRETFPLELEKENPHMG
jgi:hypothetical protein